MFVNMNFKNAVLIMLLGISFLVSGANEIKAAWGTFDTSFGNAGTFQDIKPNSYPNSVLVQPDGKILVTGATYLSNGKRRLMLRRWTANGEIDTTFGNNGSAVVSSLINPDYDYEGGKIAILSSGKIAVVGMADWKFCVWVFNSNGYADTNFGTNGLKIMPEYHYFYGRIGTRDTKLILGVYHKNYKRVIIHQLNADGSDDTAFGSEGRSYTNIFHTSGASPSYEMVTGQSQNKITIVGISNHPQYGQIKRIDRINQDGSIDFTFTPTQTAVPYGGHITGIAKLSNGDFIYSDKQSVSVDFDSRLYKVDWNGTTVLTKQISDADNLIALQRNGKSVVGNGFNDYLSRYDNLFNFLDAAVPNFNTDYYYVGATQTDDKVVFATNVDNKLTLFRWLAN